jgi:hypothetical protein
LCIFIQYFTCRPIVFCVNCIDIHILFIFTLLRAVRFIGDKVPPLCVARGGTWGFYLVVRGWWINHPPPHHHHCSTVEIVCQDVYLICASLDLLISRSNNVSDVFRLQNGQFCMALLMLRVSDFSALLYFLDEKSPPLFRLCQTKSMVQFCIIRSHKVIRDADFVCLFRSCRFAVYIYLLQQPCCILGELSRGFIPVSIIRA